MTFVAATLAEGRGPVRAGGKKTRTQLDATFGNELVCGGTVPRARLPGFLRVCAVLKDTSKHVKQLCSAHWSII